MPFNSVFSWFIKKRIHQIDLFRKYPVEVQDELFERLINEGSLTSFGIEHGFLDIRTPEDFKKAVPVRDYNELKPYIDRIIDGEEMVLWPSRTRWFAKSSGTTSDRSKYIPVTKEALEDCHYKGGKDLLAMYYHNHPDASLYKGKHLVMGGSSEFIGADKERYVGDLSAIIIRNLPIWAEFRRTPSRDIALMDNWEEKIDRIVHSTIDEDVHILIGVPSWTLVMLKRMLEITGARDITEVWPNLELFMHGGVNFTPYRKQFEALIPNKEMQYYESYNASEGFFGIQDENDGHDLLLMLDYGIYYEFMPLSELGKSHPETIGLKDVEIGQNYALVISTNAGLWRYLIGDTVRFTSVRPYRIQVSGRTKHYINTFGEEVMVENTDDAIAYACEHTGATMTDYTVAPVYMSDSHTGGHEWLIEFVKEPADIRLFTEYLDQRLREVNSDYAAKRSGDLTLRMPLVQVAPTHTFYNWLKSKDKVGGQHKVPRLSNDRDHLEEILSTIVVA
ncbi:MAG: GH3 auxin-responsive promoter family protein [Flavobacteriales bacterium]|nr:GH3 auxin-responsive promoter family protein [Flavobacteriales bacterium]